MAGLEKIPKSADLTPIEYFKGFLCDGILDKICHQSNLYAIQQNANKPLNLCIRELEQ